MKKRNSFKIDKIVNGVLAAKVDISQEPILDFGVVVLPYMDALDKHQVAWNASAKFLTNIGAQPNTPYSSFENDVAVLTAAARDAIAREAKKILTPYRTAHKHAKAYYEQLRACVGAQGDLGQDHLAIDDALKSSKVAASKNGENHSTAFKDFATSCQPVSLYVLPVLVHIGHLERHIESIHESKAQALRAIREAQANYISSVEDDGSFDLDDEMPF